MRADRWRKARPAASLRDVARRVAVRWPADEACRHPCSIEARREPDGDARRRAIDRCCASGGRAARTRAARCGTRRAMPGDPRAFRPRVGRSARSRLRRAPRALSECPPHADGRAAAEADVAECLAQAKSAGSEVGRGAKWRARPSAARRSARSPASSLVPSSGNPGRGAAVGAAGGGTAGLLHGVTGPRPDEITRRFPNAVCAIADTTRSAGAERGSVGFGVGSIGRIPADRPVRGTRCRIPEA